MASEKQVAIEAEIEAALLEQWDPLGKRGEPGYDGYKAYAHDLYNLLARGGSDVQVTRRLHEAEAVELGHPELVERDISGLVRILRGIERRI